MGTLRVRLSPDVDPQQLRVGKLAWLSRERNCLLEIDDTPPFWTEVGTFDRYLEGRRRILVRWHEQLLPLTVADEFAERELKKGDQIGFEPPPVGLAYERLDKEDTAHLFNEDTTHEDFSRLGGLDREINQIIRVLDFSLLHGDVAARYRLQERRGILLEGPPGNGKTAIARCVASYLREQLPGKRCRFMEIIGASKIYSMWLGESEARIAERFEAAREAAADGPVVMFFDELDALGRKRGDVGSNAPDRILASLLGQLDSTRRLSNTFFIAATNRADMLDPALLRPGRFDLKLRIPAPRRAAARMILGRYLDGLPLEQNGSGSPEPAAYIEPLLSAIYSPSGPYAELARVRLADSRILPVAGRQLVSGAMLEHVVSRAAEEAAQRDIETGKSTGVGLDDLLSALHAELLGSVRILSPENVKNYLSSIPQDARPVSVEPHLEALASPNFIRAT